MLGSFAAVAAVIIAAGSLSQSTLVGTIASIAVLVSGAQLVVATSSGATTTIDVSPNAAVRERPAGGDWHATSAASLKVGEPVALTLDASGKAVKIDAEYKVVDTRAVTIENGSFIGTDGIVREFVGEATAASAIPLGAYVELRTDPSTGDAFDVAVSSRPFANAANSANAVAVTFLVRVPVNTPASSTVYLATNSQNWTPNAIRMAPEPGNMWTVTIDLAAGTLFQYKYTRGSWSASECDASGSAIQSRTLTVAGGQKTQAASDVVARWTDLPS
jgi:hypothetical protein